MKSFKEKEPSFKFVYIEWIDPTSPTDAEWHDHEDLDEWWDIVTKKQCCKDLGIIIKENQEQVMIGGFADLWNPEARCMNKYYHREVVIPKGCIRIMLDLTAAVNKCLFDHFGKSKLQKKT